MRAEVGIGRESQRRIGMFFTIAYVRGEDVQMTVDRDGVHLRTATRSLDLPPVGRVVERGGQPTIYR